MYSLSLACPAALCFPSIGYPIELHRHAGETVPLFHSLPLPAWQTRSQVRLKEISMKRNNRYIACALFLSEPICAPAISFAQSPFDGTWHINLGATQFS